jgi:glycosyltransferase involved in cell wall biosynthesis
MKRILILYRELAGYFVECVNHLCDNFGVEADIVAYPVNADAPFLFSFSPKVKVYDRNKVDLAMLLKMTESGDYDLIFCGGWGDKDYIKAVASRKRANALLGFDNQWQGSPKQILASAYARFKITPLFDVAFVPGQGQFLFARKMGFAAKKVIQGAYSCDVQKFNVLYEARKSQRLNGPKKLVYVGRYAPEKFVNELFEAFKELCDEGLANWQLHAAGVGPLWDKRLQHAAIVHHGFQQPAALFEIMKEGNVFVLPSTFEPWGVVVHEFAAAGYPLILSDKVGAKEAFLSQGENGIIFKAGLKSELKSALKKILNSTDKELQNMGNLSHKLALRITPDTWARSLFDLMK